MNEPITDRKCRTHVHRHRECLKLGIAVSMHGNTRQHRASRFAVTFFFNFAAWRCYPCNLHRNHQEKRWWVAKTNASKRLVCWLENSRFKFQKLLCKWGWSRDKSDLKSITNIAAVIMRWLSQGIYFICWNVGIYKHFRIPRSSHE